MRVATYSLAGFPRFEPGAFERVVDPRGETDLLARLVDEEQPRATGEIVVGMLELDPHGNPRKSGRHLMGEISECVN